MTQPKFTNRLALEKSPYLRQHAHNPVDWYPWNPATLAIAKEQGKPIFLSIGYATCHWCHVMERESFEDEEIAKQMNELFINIKVDREELPQVDALYMDIAQAMMQGVGGWPLNLILTPDQKPIFAATYLPPKGRPGMLGLTELMNRIGALWNSDEKEVAVRQSEAIMDVIEQHRHIQGDTLPPPKIVDETTELLFKLSDPVYGGMKGSPKFPLGNMLVFLLKYSVAKHDSRALFLASKTLEMMYRGGIFDHLGGGFSRYTVDANWLTPHFEKMLYDNAILIETYVHAWQITKNPLFWSVASKTGEYLQREMTDPGGGFYSAEDSESLGNEGFFYTWLYSDLQTILSEQADIFCSAYGATPSGNFEGRNILHIGKSVPEIAKAKGMTEESVQKILNTQKTTLWNIRETAPHPLKDKKILTSWNGLAIYSLALMGATFDDPNWSRLAEEGATFILKHCYKERLFRRWMEGETAHPATLDDYAFLIRALLLLFETGSGTKWLETAIQLMEQARLLYKGEGGAYYQTSSDDPTVILRNIQYSDGSEPSGNAAQAENLLKLYSMTHNPNYLAEADDIFHAIGNVVATYPPGYIYHIMNLLRYYDEKKANIVIALNEKEDHFHEIRSALFQKLIPHSTIVWRRVNDEKLFALIPFLKEQGPIGGKTTLYMCYNGACLAPLTEIEQIRAVLS